MNSRKAGNKNTSKMHFSDTLKKIIFFESHLQDSNRGIALIMVLAILVILFAIVGEFSYSMRIETNITRNFKEEEESYQLALAGIESAKLEILSAKEPVYVHLNKDGILVFGDADEEPERKEKLGNGTFSYTIIDEDRKFNINTVSPPRLKSLIKFSGVDFTEVDIIVDSIIDWRDTNDLHMLNGAEEEYYQSLPNPYSCKDGPFTSIYELLLVKGVIPEIFYGRKVKDKEMPYKGIAEYFTVWSSNKININTASREILETAFGIAKADNIISQREVSPLLSPVSGGSVTSTYFSVVSTGSNADNSIKRTIKVILIKNKDKIQLMHWDDNFTG